MARNVHRNPPLDDFESFLAESAKEQITVTVTLPGGRTITNTLFKEELPLLQQRVAGMNGTIEILGSEVITPPPMPKAPSVQAPPPSVQAGTSSKSMFPRVTPAVRPSGSIHGQIDMDAIRAQAAATGVQATTYPKAQRISQVVGYFKHCQGKKMDIKDRTSIQMKLLANGIDSEKADQIIKLFLEHGWLKSIPRSSDPDKLGIRVMVAGIDSYTIDALFNQLKGFPKGSPLRKTQLALDPHTGQPLLDTAGNPMSLSAWCTAISELKHIQERTATLLLAELGYIKCILTDSVPSKYNPWRSRSRALNNSGYPDTMIPLPYPRKDYEFSAPPIVAHWTSYPQYAYDQFYPDPGRLVWSGSSSGGTQGNPRTRNNPRRKN